MVKNRLPPIVEREGIIVMQNMTSMLMYVNIYSTDQEPRPEFSLQLRLRQLLPEIKRIRGIGSANDSRQPRICHAGLAESRPHAGLQRLRRRRHEGDRRTEHDRLARTTRPGDGQDVANRRVRADLGRTLQQAGAIRKHHSEGQSRRRDPAAQGRRQSRAGLFVLRPLLGHRRLSFGGHRAQADSPAPTPPKSSRRSRRSSRRSRRRRSLRAWTSRSATTFPASWTPRSRRCCTRCSRPSCWSRWWSSCSSETSRSTLIPTLAVPVSLIGTFFFMLIVRHVDQPDHALRAGAGDRRGGGRRDRGGRSGA